MIGLLKTRMYIANLIFRLAGVAVGPKGVDLGLHTVDTYEVTLSSFDLLKLSHIALVFVVVCSIASSE